MDNLERYLDRVCRGVGGSASLRRHLRQELREHIQEAAERYKATGLSTDEALQKAIADFGDPAPVHQGLEDVYGRDVMGILIEKAMQWKENTMKAKWLWSGTASLMLLVAIFAQGFFAFGVPWLIVPTMKAMFKEVGQELPEYVGWFLDLADFVILGHGWILFLVPPAAWAVFEWRFRGENKSLIRLSALAFVLLVTTALMWWAGIVAVVPMGKAYSGLLEQRPEKMMRERVRMADEAMARLRDAIQGVNPHEAEFSVRVFAGALGEVEHRGGAAAGLVTMMHPQQLDEVRRHLHELVRLAEIAHGDARSPLESRRRRFREETQELQQAYAQFKILLADWPDATTQPASQPAGANPADGR
jgi:hypothetical protein